MYIKRRWGIFIVLFHRKLTITGNMQITSERAACKTVSAFHAAFIFLQLKTNQKKKNGNEQKLNITNFAFIISPRRKTEINFEGRVSFSPFVPRPPGAIFRWFITTQLYYGFYFSFCSAEYLWKKYLWNRRTRRGKGG